jgi:hypothetical protein
MNKSRVENNLIISPDINGEFQWRGDTLMFLPDNDLKYDTKYNITLSSDAIDKWGNPLADDLSWEFTTEEKKSDNDQKGINYELELIVSIILIIIILIIIFIFILMRKKRDKSDKDVSQQQDETLEEE